MNATHTSPITSYGRAEPYHTCTGAAAELGTPSHDRLSARVANVQGHAEARPGGADQRGRGRPAAHDDGLQSRQVELVERRVPEHESDLGGNATEEAHAV